MKRYFSLNKSCLLFFLIAAFAVNPFVALTPCLAAAVVPEESISVPPMLEEQSVSTFVPSDAAPGAGLAVNVIYPQKPRYPEGAPVVVVAPGGTKASGLDFSMHAAQSGFAEVRFAFPGGGIGHFVSSGIYDARGAQSQQALHDVLLFAAGRLSDQKGRTINDLVPVKLSNSHVGMVGWSNGGNIAIITMSNFNNDLKFVDWLAFYESPVGQLFMPAVLGGGNDAFVNRHYRQGSCATGDCLVDFRKLWWQTGGSKEPGAHKKIGEPEIPGILFFDENGNKQFDESSEYALSYATDIALEKQIYAPLVTRAIIRLKIPIDHFVKVADVRESEAYFQERDGSLYIEELVKNYPNLLITMFGSVLDHWQRQPDHPHISFLYNALLANKVHWLRLNPEPHYVGVLADMNPNNFVNNKPNSSIDSSQINDYLEREGMLPDYVFMEAAIAELSDRVRAHNLAPTLPAPLVKYSNGAKAASEDADDDSEKKKAKPGAKPEVKQDFKEDEGADNQADALSGDQGLPAEQKGDQR
jgi:hypothetical protein